MTRRGPQAEPGKKQSLMQRVADAGSHLLLQGGIKQAGNLIYSLANEIGMVKVRFR